MDTFLSHSPPWLSETASDGSSEELCDLGLAADGAPETLAVPLWPSEIVPM
jgi:hypothetical protein